MIESYPDRTETLKLVRDRTQKDRDEQLCQFVQQKLAELEGQ